MQLPLTQANTNDNTMPSLAKLMYTLFIRAVVVVYTSVNNVNINNTARRN